MYGWCGANGASLIMVGKMIEESENSDHLEIGSLWGASALMAALTKIENGYDGHIYCVDPMVFSLHEPCSVRGGNITSHRAEIMPDVFRKNMKMFGVENRVTLINKSSFPKLPKELTGIRFGSVFIDGFHYGDAPLQDAKNALEVSDKFILLDDVLPYYPDVYSAFSYLAGVRDWYIISLSERSALFRKETNVENIFDYTSPYNNKVNLSEWE